MNKKKAGFITAGVVTALVAASPLAFATEGGHDKGWQKGGPGQVCQFNGAPAGAVGVAPGGGLVDALVQAPIGGNNIANIGNCSNFLNNNLNNNVSGNAIGVLSGPVVAPCSPTGRRAPRRGAPSRSSGPSTPHRVKTRGRAVPEFPRCRFPPRRPNRVRPYARSRRHRTAWRGTRG